MKTFPSLLTLAGSCFLSPSVAPGQAIRPTTPAQPFTFQSALFGPSQSISLNIESNNPTTGTVRINGYDSRRPKGTPFSWQWGDGTSKTGWFPQTHTYPNTQSNYVVTVSHSYSDGIQTAQAVVWFVAPRVQPVALPSDTAVTIATSPQTLATRLYLPPAQLTNFVASSFGAVPQSAIEYVLSTAAAMQRDFANENYFRPDNQFQQVVLCDPNIGGSFYSIWYTSPAAFGAGPTAFSGSLAWSSFFHEMGHGFSLNSPSNYYYGGKIDGNANAVLSETLAQLFQHATDYELINHGAELGYPPELIADIRNKALRTVLDVRSGYSNYLDSNKVFTTWNDPSTPDDETFNTFMTIGYKFMERAELAGQGYRMPLKRLMLALQLFNPSWKNSYAPNDNTPAAESFRATLWVAALSYAFQTDLRAEFEALNFPVDDNIYADLSQQIAELPAICPTPPHFLSMQSLPVVGPSLSLSGPILRFYAIEAGSDLSTPKWTTLGNVFNGTTNCAWYEGASTNTTRFYRSALLP